MDAQLYQKRDDEHVFNFSEADQTLTGYAQFVDTLDPCLLNYNDFVNSDLGTSDFADLVEAIANPPIQNGSPIAFLDSGSTYSSSDSEGSLFDTTMALTEEQVTPLQVFSSTAEVHDGSINPAALHLIGSPFGSPFSTSSPFSLAPVSPTIEAASSPSAESEGPPSPTSSSGGGKEHPCPTCQKPFVRRWNMLQHLKTHDSGRRRHPCPYPNCHSSFTRESDLRRHRLDTHKERKGSRSKRSSSNAVREPVRAAPQPVWTLPCGCTLIGCSAHGGSDVKEAH